MMLKIYVYGYLNQVQSSRRLERECARNLELIWLTGRLKPDFKTIADFRKDNGPASARSAGSSSRCAATSIFWTPASSRSTAASSRPSTQGEELHAREAPAAAG